MCQCARKKLRPLFHPTEMLGIVPKISLMSLQYAIVISKIFVQIISDWPQLYKFTKFPLRKQDQTYQLLKKGIFIQHFQ
jgi:hypothetical protein